MRVFIHEEDEDTIIIRFDGGHTGVAWESFEGEVEGSKLGELPDAVGVANVVRLWLTHEDATELFMSLGKELLGGNLG